MQWLRRLFWRAGQDWPRGFSDTIISCMQGQPVALGVIDTPYKVGASVAMRLWSEYQKELRNREDLLYDLTVQTKIAYMDCTCGALKLETTFKRNDRAIFSAISPLLQVSDTYEQRIPAPSIK